jgi:hypothetical protein
VAYQFAKDYSARAMQGSTGASDHPRHGAIADQAQDLDDDNASLD